MDENVGGDKIEGTVGDNAHSTAIGKDIKQDVHKAEATGNVVHIYDRPAKEPEPRPRRPARQPGKLMPDEAQELRQAIDRLTEKMSQSNIAITELKGTVGRNNDLTMRSINAFEEQLTIFKAQLATRAPVWVAYLTVTILAIIGIFVTVASIVWINQSIR